MELHVQKTIAGLEGKIRQMMEAVNAICHAHGEPARYEALGGSTQISQGQFYGRALATVVTEYLRMRRAASQGTATVAQLHAALAEGGYDFNAKSDDYAKRGLRQSLTKNPKFHKLPDGSYGLKEWYPAAKDSKETESATSGDPEPDAGDAAEASDLLE